MDASVVYDDVRRTVAKLDNNLLEAEREVRELKARFSESLRQLSDLQLGMEMRQTELTRLRSETKAQVENESENEVKLTRLSMRPQLLRERDEKEAELTEEKIQIARQQISSLEAAMTKQRADIEPVLATIREKLSLYCRVLDVSISHPSEGGIHIQFNETGKGFDLRWDSSMEHVELIAPECDPEVRGKVEDEFRAAPSFGKLLVTIRKQLI